MSSQSTQPHNVRRPSNGTYQAQIYATLLPAPASATTEPSQASASQQTSFRRESLTEASASNASANATSNVQNRATGTNSTSTVTSIASTQTYQTPSSSTATTPSQQQSSLHSATSTSPSSSTTTVSPAAPSPQTRSTPLRPASASAARSTFSQSDISESPGAPTIQPRRPRTAVASTSTPTDTDFNASSTSPGQRILTVSDYQSHYMSPWDMHLSDAGPITNRFNYYFSRAPRSIGAAAAMGAAELTGIPHSIMQREYGDPRLHYAQEAMNIYANGSTNTNAHHGTTGNTNMRPHFRTKVVCILDCKHCNIEVCRRGMKAILLADMNIELFSTDAPPYSVQLVNDDYQTRNCYCRIRDVACLGCGNVIGYHVTQPCEPCMDACNNGHFWMFHVSEVVSRDRTADNGKGALLWSQLPRPDRDAVNASRQIEAAR